MKYIKTDDVVKIAREELTGFRFIFERIKKRVEEAPPADVVSKERYTNLLANSIIVCDALKKYQSADMVEVVRCKHCRFWKTETDPIGIECEPGETAHYCSLECAITRSTDFCSYGDINNEESTERTD